MKYLRGSSCVAVLLMAFAALRVAAQPLEPIRYTVSFPAAQTHYMEVEASFPTGGQPQIDLMMAVWTPAVLWSASFRVTSKR